MVVLLRRQDVSMLSSEGFRSLGKRVGLIVIIAVVERFELTAI